MIKLDFLYHFCLHEYQYYIKSYDKCKNDTKMADWYIAKANAFACVMRVLEVIKNRDSLS